MKFKIKFSEAGDRTSVEKRIRGSVSKVRKTHNERIYKLVVNLAFLSKNFITVSSLVIMSVCPSMPN